MLIEKAIMKIGHLLAVGFGEAGSKIIADNIKLIGDVNPHIAGTKIIGIFCFCEIHNFLDVT